MKNSTENRSFFDLTGKKALVTGGGKGLGLAITQALIKAGASVRITGRDEAALQRAVETLGDQCSYAVYDLSLLGGITVFAEDLYRSFGAVDILVNNAGINLKKDFLELTDADFDRIIKTNQYAVFSLTRELAKAMVARGSGSIIMISSMASQYGIPKVVAYSASKAAVEGMTRAMAVELSPLGVRVNCIAPGFMATEMSAKALNNDTERMQKVMSRTPMGKMGQPSDIGNAVVYLSSDEAGYVTGVVLPVDGGNSIGF
jgi:NAD(P)-dependent dehydrogenase (short-subunit alcohol dehydrogenase family)